MSSSLRAFIYTEIDNSEESPRKGQTMYTIHYPEKYVRGYRKMQSPDENLFIQELKDIKRNNNITLLSKLPRGVEGVEGTITRTPYDISKLLK